MANSIALFKKYIDLLDEVYKSASKSSVLDIDGKLVRAGLNANEIVTTVTTVENVSATHSETFTAKIINALYDVSGSLILSAECNSKGDISAYFDKNNLQIFTSDFEKNIAGNISGFNADAAAIAYAIAKNSEQKSSLDKQKKAYQKGIKKGSENGGNPVRELFEEDVPDGVVNYDVDLNSANDFDENADGIYLTFSNPQTQETGYIHIYNDGKPALLYGNPVGKGCLKVELIGSSNLFQLANGNDTVFETVSYRTAFFKVIPGKEDYNDELINGLKIHSTWIDASLVGFGWNYENGYVRCPYWIVKDGVKCVRISNFPPEGVN